MSVKGTVKVGGEHAARQLRGPRHGSRTLAPVAGTAGRNWHGSAHLKRAWMCGRQMRPPPGRGDCWILKIAHAPSPKNLSKNGLPQKGGSLSVEGVFAKKFAGVGEDSAVDACVRLQSRACAEAFKEPSASQ